MFNYDTCVSYSYALFLSLEQLLKGLLMALPPMFGVESWTSRYNGKTGDFHLLTVLIKGFMGFLV